MNKSMSILPRRKESNKFLTLGCHCDGCRMLSKLKGFHANPSDKLRKDYHNEYAIYFYPTDLVTLVEETISEEFLNLRRAIIDWMIVVCKILNITDIAFVSSVQILDKVAKHYNYEVSNDDLQLIAMCALFISSKFHDVNHMRINTLIKSVGHEKFGKSDLLGTERIILSILKYRIPQCQIWDFLNVTLTSIYPSENCKFRNILFAYAISIFKMLILNHPIKETDFSTAMYASVCYYSYIDIYTKLIIREDMFNPRLILKTNIFTNTLGVHLENSTINYLYIKQLKEKYERLTHVFPYINKEELIKYSYL